MATFSLIAILLGLGGPMPLSARNVPPTTTNTDSLRTIIGRMAAGVEGAVVGVAFHDLESGDSLYLNADDSFHAASTMKVPVMSELFRRVDAGRLSLDQPVPLKNEFT